MSFLGFGKKSELERHLSGGSDKRRMLAIIGGIVVMGLVVAFTVFDFGNLFKGEIAQLVSGTVVIGEEVIQEMGDTFIKVSADSGGFLRISITDFDGKEVREFESAFLEKNTSFTAIWDGRNNHDVFVKAGNYSVKVYFNDAYCAAYGGGCVPYEASFVIGEGTIEVREAAIPEGVVYNGETLLGGDAKLSIDLEKEEFVKLTYKTDDIYHYAIMQISAADGGVVNSLGAVDGTTSGSKSTVFKWSGLDEGGNKLPAGDYTYKIIPYKLLECANDSAEACPVTIGGAAVAGTITLVGKEVEAVKPPVTVDLKYQYEGGHVYELVSGTELKLDIGLSQKVKFIVDPGEKGAVSVSIHTPRGGTVAVPDGVRTGPHTFEWNGDTIAGYPRVDPGEYLYLVRTHEVAACATGHTPPCFGSMNEIAKGKIVVSKSQELVTSSEVGGKGGTVVPCVQNETKDNDKFVCNNGTWVECTAGGKGHSTGSDGKQCDGEKWISAAEKSVIAPKVSLDVNPTLIELKDYQDAVKLADAVVKLKASGFSGIPLSFVNVKSDIPAKVDVLLYKLNSDGSIGTSEAVLASQTELKGGNVLNSFSWNAGFDGVKVAPGTYKVIVKADEKWKLPELSDTITVVGVNQETPDLFVPGENPRPKLLSPLVDVVDYPVNSTGFVIKFERPMGGGLKKDSELDGGVKVLDPSGKNIAKNDALTFLPEASDVSLTIPLGTLEYGTTYQVMIPKGLITLDDVQLEKDFSVKFTTAAKPAANPAAKPAANPAANPAAKPAANPAVVPPSACVENSISDDGKRVCAANQWIKCEVGNQGTKTADRKLECKNELWVKVPDAPSAQPPVSDVKITKASVFPVGFDPQVNEAKITYAISGKSEVEIRILTSSGVSAVTLVDGKILDAGEYFVWWDGTDSVLGSGKIADPGKYEYKITAKDPNNGTVKDVKKGDINIVYSKVVATTASQIFQAPQPSQPSNVNNSQAAATVVLQNSTSGSTAQTGPGILIYALFPLGGLIIKKFKK